MSGGRLPLYLPRAPDGSRRSTHLSVTERQYHHSGAAREASTLAKTVMSEADERPAPADLEGEVRRYYRTVSRFIDRERLGRSDRAFWRAAAREHRGGAGLDLGCGTGRVTRLLAGELAWMVGVDLSPEMLALARGRAGRWRGAAGRVSLAAADMRSLALRRRFDLVTAANDPLAHLGSGEDRDRTLAAVAAHLAPGGRFVLDAHWFPPKQLARARAAAGLVLEHPGRGGLRVRETWRCAPDGSCRARYEYRREGELLARAAFRSRYWTEPEVEERFARAGLAVTAFWGGWDRAPWRPESARRLLVEARLAEGVGSPASPLRPDDPDGPPP